LRFKNNIKAIILPFTILFITLISIQTTYAVTNEEWMNNMIGPKQQYNTMLSPAYVRNNTSEESISPQSGEISLAQTDYVLPGINGLDLEIKRIYESGSASIREMKAEYVDGVWVDQVYSDSATSSFYEDRYNLGIGMRFSFPAIEIKNNEDGTNFKYLHTEAGDVYKLGEPYKVEDVNTYILEGQTVNDVIIREDKSFRNGQPDETSFYVMTDKTGKKTYFSEDGRVLGIVDRYDNKITFQYTTLTYSVEGYYKTQALISKIIDTMGRSVNIEYKQDQNFSVGPIKNDKYTVENSFKASQNPNTTNSGDLKEKFQVIITLPNSQKIVYDKSGVLVNNSGNVIRTRLQRVYDVDGKPKYHFWYDQPELGFTFTNGAKYSAYNRYENLTQIDYCKTNKIERFSYNTFTKRLSDKGSMQYRKIFEKKELEKIGFDSSRGNFLDAFICNVKDNEAYKYTNGPDGYGYSGYEGINNIYLKNTYRYYTDKTDFKNTVMKYTYNGIHEQINVVESGNNHETTSITEYDEKKFPKKIETISQSRENRQPKGQAVKKIENFRYDDDGNLTYYAAPDVKRDGNGTPVDEKDAVSYAYDYNRFDVLISKTWKQDKDTQSQILYTVDDKGNVIKERKVHTGEESSWIVTDYEYDKYGNMTKKTVHSEGNDFVTNYEYGVDAVGVNQKGAYLTKQYSIADRGEISKKYAYDFNTGNMIVEFDGNGNKTSYEYDSLSRIKKINYPDNTVKQYMYNNFVTKNREIEYIDQIGSKFMYRYDIFGNQIEYYVALNGEWQSLLMDEYDSQGNKIKEIDANGNSTRFVYNSQNMLVRKDFYEKDITKKETITLSYTHGPNPDTYLMVVLTDEDGYDRRMYYDVMNRLVKSEATPDKSKFYASSIVYNYVGNVVSETDAKGNKTSYFYDDLGRLVSRKDALNNEIRYSYNSIDKLILQEEPGSRTVNFLYDNAGRTIEQRVFDKALPGNFTYKKYKYDKNDNVLTVEQGKQEAGSKAVSAYTEYSYDSMDRPVDQFGKIDDNRKTHKKYVYDSKGNATSVSEYIDEAGTNVIKQLFDYDFGDRVLREESSMQYDGTERGRYIKKYGYDMMGNRTSEEIFDGLDFNKSTYRYDYRSRPLEKLEPVNSDGKIRTIIYSFDKRGNLASETTNVSGTDRTTQYQYNGFGKISARIDPMGYVSKYLYDENGNLIKEIDPRYSSQDLQTAPGIEYEYDALNRQFRISANNGSTKTVTIYKQYDGRGNVIKEADGTGYNSEKPADSYGILYEYDANNNVVLYTSAQAASENAQNGTRKYTRKYTYDGSGRMLSETDFYGNVTVNTYLLSGLLKQTVYPDKTSESYSYDLTGKAMSVKTDKAGNKTTVYSNLFNKPYMVEYPDNAVETMEYSSKGELLKSDDRAGNADYFQYDLLGNMTDKKEYRDSDASFDYYRHIITRYDEAGSILSTETFEYKVGKGTLTGGIDTSVGDRVTYSYDKNGKTLKLLGPSGRETLIEYDKKGNITTKKQKIAGDNYQITRFKYDVQSRLIEEDLLVDTSDLDTNYVRNLEFDSEYTTRVKARTNYAYYNNGQLRTKTDANGNSSTIEYNFDNKPVKRIDALNSAISYSYDLNGNILEEKNAKGISTYYEYDPMNRLIRKKEPTAGNGHAVTRYIYDVMGNLKKQVQPNSYVPEMDTPELADSMEGMSYTYDNMNRRNSTILPDGKVIEYLKYDVLGNVIKKVDGLRFNGSIETSPGNSYKYDSAGNVLRITDVIGNSKKYRYDILGRVLENTDERGNLTVFDYNGDGTLAKAVYADGGKISYTYDLMGRIVSLTNQLGNTTKYSYNSFGNKKSETDEYGNTLEIKTDLTGNVVSSKDKRDSILYITYDALGRPVKKRTPVEKDGSGNILYAVESYTYDEAGNISAKVLTGTKDKLSSRTTNYTYYENNLVNTVSDSSGSFARSYYDKNGNLVKKEILRSEDNFDIQKFEYDNLNRLVKEISLVGENDIYEASKLPNIEMLRDPENPGRLMLITAYTYDIMGNMTSKTSPLAFTYNDDDIQSRDNYTIYYSYDVLNRLGKVIRKYDGRDVSTSYTYDESGNRLSEKNERGFETRFTYDELSRVKTLTDAINNTISYTFDLAGNKLSETNSKGDTMAYAYDKLNRVVTVTDSYGLVVSKKVYDANGNIVKEIDALGYLSADDDASRYGTLFTYDLANRLVARAAPEAATQDKITASYEYNQYGEVVKQTDGTGNTSTYDYDAAGRLTKVTDPLGIATKYSYDKQGGKLTMTDGKGKLTRYSYTAFGNLKTVMNPDNKAISYKYDLTGKAACITDKNGNNTIYTYDNSGLMLERKVLETGDSVSYMYDEAGNRKAMSDASGTSSYSYDGNNRIFEITKDGAAQISYSYDQVGNVTKVTDSKGNTVCYTYDNSNRMETVASNGKTTIYTYDENGRRTAVTYNGGVSEKYTYDKDNQLISLVNSNANGAVISEYDYEYDLSGRQITKTDSFGSTNYTYDKAGRILKVTTPGKTTVYSYDNAGNRVSQNETYTSVQPSGFVDEATGKDIQYILKKSDYTYSSSNTLLKLSEGMFDENSAELARKTTKYVYDNNGNQLHQTVSYVLPDNTKLRPASKGAAYGDNITGTIDKLVEKTSYQYDGFNHLKKSETVKDGIRTTAEYTYDGDDLRVRKTAKKSDKGYEAEVTNYLYDRQNVILETDANNNVKARYVKGINYISKVDASNKEAYFLFNGHGDVVQTADGSGTILNQYDYDIWGNPVLTIETAENAIRYSGEFMDSETGLYYLRARYYDPYIGRFTTEDSYWGEDKNPLSLNLYTYCHNDPVNFIDPSGHKEAYLTDLAASAGNNNVKWDAKTKSATLTVNGIKQTITVGKNGAKIVNNKIVIDSKVFDNLFANTETRTYITTTVNEKTINSTMKKYNADYSIKSTWTRTSTNNLNAKQSPKPKEQEAFSLENEKKNDSKSNNINDVAVLQVALDAKGYMDMPLSGDGKTITYGYYGDLTEKAVNSLQTDIYSSVGSVQKYLVNGVVDSATWSKLGLPLDANGQPDRNSDAYKKLLQVAKSRDTLSYGEYQEILAESNNKKSNTPVISIKIDIGVKVELPKTQVQTTNGAAITVNPDKITASGEGVNNGTNIANNVKDFITGTGAGALESITYGVSNELEAYYDRNNNIIYMAGKVTGDTIIGILSGIGTVASGTFTVVAGPTLVGAVAGAAATAYCATVTINAAGHAAVNVHQIISNNSGSSNEGVGKTEITAGKNFKDHFINHKKILEDAIGTKYPKFKEDGSRFLEDVGKIIDDGTVQFVGQGTLKKGTDICNIYRGNGMTVVTKPNGEFVTILEQGKGMDLGIQLVK
jgi:RHS repeat-associated protein